MDLRKCVGHERNSKVQQAQDSSTLYLCLLRDHARRLKQKTVRRDYSQEGMKEAGALALRGYLSGEREGLRDGSRVG